MLCQHTQQSYRIGLDVQITGDGGAYAGGVFSQKILPHKPFKKNKNKITMSIEQPPFLPTSRDEMHALDWDALDVLFITGDAYVDHPAFGVALLGRWLVAHGFKVGVCAQPRWNCTDDIVAMGRPRLYAGITAGALDSLLAHYTAFRKKRHDDAYTPGGEAGARPNRASVVYANLARQAFPGLPLVLGGIEASLRRITHYDFWTDSLRRSLLLDAKADVLVYGMGERAVLELAQRCDRGEPLTHIRGTAWMEGGKKTEGGKKAEGEKKAAPEDAAPHVLGNALVLPSHEDMLADMSLLMDATLALEAHVHAHVHGNAYEDGQYAIQMNGKRALVIAPPALPLTEADMDALYELPFQRAAHPSYKAAIPAEEMLRTSITSHRGCGGGCAFCSLALHQGRHISARSEASLLNEAQALTRVRRRKKSAPVSISDVGGPTANMWQGRCTLPQDKQCRRTSCCHPAVCPHFVTPQKAHIAMLRRVKAVEGVGHVRVASGIRADIAAKEPEAILAYTREFTGGQLKIAPEHCAADVLFAMRKPSIDVFERFLQDFLSQSRKAGREQYVVPYLMSAFPGCTNAHMHELAAWLRERHWKPQQVQCFIPTPGTVATAQRLEQHHILIPTPRGRKR